MRIFIPSHLRKLRKVAKNNRGQEGEAGGRRCVFCSVHGVTQRDLGIEQTMLAAFL